MQERTEKLLEKLNIAPKDTGFTLGSLFDGSGTAPLTATILGITPVWASEIEPFPVEVTKKRFPDMLQLGDITKIDGRKIPPVNIIVGGSPCQNLSLAGRRAGLHGDRSSLFFEQIRIIKEMREATHGKYPTFIIWENVPGALSSGKPAGEDFRIVLEEFCKIKDGSATVPVPEKGKWKDAGYIMGDEFSVSWRILDSEFWGVPQRRKRIFLCASFDSPLDLSGDYGIGSAGQVLLVRKGLSRDFKALASSWEATSRRAEEGTGRPEHDDVDGPVLCLNDQGGQVMSVSDNKTATLRAQEHGHQPVVCVKEKTQGLDIYNGAVTGEVACTLTTATGQSASNSGPSVMEKKELPNVICIQGNCIDRADNAGCDGRGWNDEGVSYTLNTIDRPAVLSYANVSFAGWQKSEVSATLRATGGNNGGGSESLIKSKKRLRRITPTECARLQGFPPWWCEEVPGRTDTKEYKMWGNGMSLPCMMYVIEGVLEQLELYGNTNENTTGNCKAKGEEQ